MHHRLHQSGTSPAFAACVAWPLQGQVRRAAATEGQEETVFGTGLGCFMGFPIGFSYG